MARWLEDIRSYFPQSVVKVMQQDALERLNALVNSVAVPPRVRRATKPTYGSQQRRLQSKTQRGETKALRGRVRDGA